MNRRQCRPRASTELLRALHEVVRVFQQQPRFIDDAIARRRQIDTARMLAG